MGRNQRKQRRQTGSQAVSAARRWAGGGRGGMYAGIAVLAVMVAAGVRVTRSRNTQAAIPPVQVSATYPTGWIFDRHNLATRGHGYGGRLCHRAEPVGAHR